jgi:ribosomal protein S1
MWSKVGSLGSSLHAEVLFIFLKAPPFSVDLENKKVEMTFRSGDLKRDKTAFLSLTDLNEGQKVDGRIKKVEDYGLFIQIDGSKLSGLCHKSEVHIFTLDSSCRRAF